MLTAWWTPNSVRRNDPPVTSGHGEVDLRRLLPPSVPGHGVGSAIADSSAEMVISCIRASDIHTRYT